MSDDTTDTARVPAADAKDSQKKPTSASPARPRYEVLLELSATVHRQLLLLCSGGRISAGLRELTVEAVGQAVAAGLPTRDACTAVGICERTYQRWRRLQEAGQNFDHRSCTAHPPSRADLRAQRLEVLADPRHAGMSAYQLVMTLYDQGRYVGSVSTVYREMRRMREAARAARRSPPPDDWRNAFYPSGSNQLWSMDFTELPLYGGFCCRLCVLMDVYDRYAAAVQVAECVPGDTGADIASAATLAGSTFTTAMHAQLGSKAADTPLMLRTDCSSAWKHPNFLAALKGTSVHHTCSRHLHPTDNALSERLWETLKSYDLPRRGFSSLQAARRWAAHAVRRYNEEHHHSSLMGLTPLQYRRGEQAAILARRRRTQAASPGGTSQEEENARGGDALKGCRPRPGRLRMCTETAESSDRRMRKLQRLRDQRRARRRKRPR